MDVNFAPINLQALLKLQELAMEDPALVGAILGVPDESIQILGDLSPELISTVARVRAPLFRPRGDAQWWHMFLDALHRGNDDEINAILECVSVRGNERGFVV